MKIWFDTEFYENGRTIELISIGLVREDDAVLYLETQGASYLASCSDWLKANVLPHLRGGDAVMGLSRIASRIRDFVGDRPEFWAYYADYDWVALCQLYGRMIDLPKGWPMFCRDLRQLADSVRLPAQEGVEHHALADALWAKSAHEWFTRYMIENGK